MPRTNIVFVKLYLSLFDNDRFLYQLTERQQLLYIKLLYLAGRTHNRIPNNLMYIAHKVNYGHGEDNFRRDIEQIRRVFPKFTEKDGFFRFDNFDKLHNYIEIEKGVPRSKPQGEPEERKKTNKVFAYFCEGWQRKNGKKYSPNYGKDKKIFKDLLQEHSEEEIQTCVDKFFTLKDDFAKQGGYTVGVFKSQFNRLRVKKDGGIVQF